MKKLIYSLSALALAGTVFIIACKKDAKPGFTPSATTAGIGTPISFKDNEADRKNASYTWDFGDGTRSNERNPSHTYWTPGKYTVYQTVTVNKNAEKGTGFTQSATSDVTITGPVASFTASATSVSVNQTVAFTNTSTGANTYYWSYVSSNGTTWNSGMTSTKDITIAFTAAGTYSVTLWADVQGSTGNSFSVTAPTVITVGGASTPNGNSAAKGMLYGKWTFGSDNFTVSYAAGFTGCPGIFLDPTAYDPAKMVHTSLTFNEDGTCWLIDPLTGNQTTGYAGTWSMNAAGTFLTLHGFGNGPCYASPGGNPDIAGTPTYQQTLPGGTYSITTLTSSSLILDVKDECSNVPTATRHRVLTLSK